MMIFLNGTAAWKPQGGFLLVFLQFSCIFMGFCISGTFGFYQRVCYVRSGFWLTIQHIFFQSVVVVCWHHHMLAYFLFNCTLHCFEVYFIAYCSVLQYIAMYFTVHLTAVFLHIYFPALNLLFSHSLDIILFILICIWISLFMYCIIVFYELAFC